MKKLIFILTTLISLSSCDRNDPITQENSIYGTWKLVEIYGSDGGSNPKWTSVTIVYTYTFNENGSFTSSRFSECTSGTYTIENDKLILNFGCEGFTTGIESPQGTFIEQMRFENGNLILKPTYLNCIEGCGWKFDKL